jgi:hypothetical protein
MSGEKISKEKKVVAETKLVEETKLFEEKKVVDPYIAGFIESMAKTNTEKITKEILEGLSEDTGDSDSYDVESGDEDSEDRPWRPSHAVFGSFFKAGLRFPLSKFVVEVLKIYQIFLHQITPKL